MILPSGSNIRARRSPSTAQARRHNPATKPKRKRERNFVSVHSSYRPIPAIREKASNDRLRSVLCLSVPELTRRAGRHHRAVTGITQSCVKAKSSSGSNYARLCWPNQYRLQNINIGDFELRSPEALRDELARNKAAPADVLGSFDIEQRSPATGLRRLGALWPLAWLALAGVATLGWIIGLGWAAVALVGWLIA